MNTNRNLWSQQEAKTLVTNCTTLGIAAGITKASSTLGRGETACRQKWAKERIRLSIPKTSSNGKVLPKIPSSVTTNEHKIVKDNMKITYHNGSTHSMNIIAKTEGLIVAKINDIVVTIEL